MAKNEIHTLSGVQIRKAIRSKKLSPVEVVEAFLERINRINPVINAYCTVTAEIARKEARAAEKKVMKGEALGLLHGVPVSIKDLSWTKGIRTTGGSLLYEHFIPDQDVIFVQRLKNAGAIILGKTNTPEFGWAGVTNNRVFGPSRNPWNTNLTTGGSSGGAAAAVAAGLGPLAQGSDGGGSIRTPSSFCGVYGLKPSYGRVPQSPGFPGLWEGLSVTGPITRTVADAALMLEVMGGYDARYFHSIPQPAAPYLRYVGGDLSLQGLKVAWTPDMGYATVDTNVKKVFEKAVRVFSTLGCELIKDHPAAPDPVAPFSTQVACAMVGQLGPQMADKGHLLDPGLRTWVESNLNINAGDYVRARMLVHDYWSRVSPFFEKYDLLLTPVLAVPPFSVEQYRAFEINGQKVHPLAWMPFTYPFNMTGQPVASIPCGFTRDNLPIGMQIVGRRYDEGLVLKASAAFEKAQPWADKTPPVYDI